MHFQVNLTIATSFKSLPLRNTILQRYFFSCYHSSSLYIHCICNRGINDTICEYLIDKQDFYCHIVFLLFILLMSCLGKNVMNYFRDIMFTWFAVEYIIYNVAFMNLCCICLHHRGALYIRPSTIRRLNMNKKPLVGVYYTKGINKWKKSSMLGTIDFMIYNILILLVIPQSSSITIKLCVTFGSIATVQIGQLLMIWFLYHFEVQSAPGVPLPVIMVSIYIFLLDFIMLNVNQCVKL
ncbi:unnamed protein product [Rotaria sordida]|uniref:Uncharacterized protein n=1 Tax=Rotaria sordida TaxID=392033 RepID=A0A816DSI2_9BILA|nr:unnamed protein product [Rotaria sordida]CAF1638521.1 unnamed protein product [Rotaria sordida]